MITVRSENPEDYDQVFKVLSDAFKQDNEGRLVEALRKSPSFVPELSLVALLNKTIVGHVLFTKVIVKSEIKETEILSLAPVAVLSKYQNQGIGSSLIRKGLEECKRLDFGIVNVLGHPNYYPRFGFKPASQYGIKAAFEAPDDAFMIMELVPGAVKGVSGVLIYPPEFNIAL